MLASFELASYQDVFALLVSSCCDKSGTSCYHLVTRLMTVTDLLQVFPTRLIGAARIKKLIKSAWKYLLSCNRPLKCLRHASVKTMNRNAMWETCGKNAWKTHGKPVRRKHFKGLLPNVYDFFLSIKSYLLFIILNEKQSSGIMSRIG